MSEREAHRVGRSAGCFSTIQSDADSRCCLTQLLGLRNRLFDRRQPMENSTRRCNAFAEKFLQLYGN